MFQEDTQGFTELAHNQQRNRHIGDDKLMVQFHVLAMLDQNRSAKEGRPCFNDTEHVRILVPGNKDSIIDRPVTEMDRNRFRKQYEDWRSGRAELVTGTTLEAASQDPSNDNLRLTLSQIEEFKFFNVKTVEQLADMADVNLQKFMGAQVFREGARKYLAQAKEQAGETWAKAQLAERDNEIATLRQAIEEQGQMIQELQGKRRPPKVSAG